MRGYLRERDRRAPGKRKGPQKRWQLVIDDGVEVVDGVKHRLQRFRSFFGTRREAENALHDFIQEVKTGVAVRDQKRTVAQYLDAWLKQKRPMLASKTYLAYSAHLRLYLKPALGEIRLASLRKEHVKRALAEWIERPGFRQKDRPDPKALSPRTIHHIFSTFRTAMHDALDEGAITVLPFGKRMMPKKGRCEISALDETQILALLEYLDGTLVGPVARLAALTGMRRGELLALMWEDVDFDRRVLQVRQAVEVVGEGKARTVRFKAPKTEKSRRNIALTDRAIDLLRSHHAAQSQLHVFLGGPFGDERLVFPNPRTGEPWKPDSFSGEFRDNVATSGLPKVTFHGLRHSYASISLRAGTPLKVVSEALGHTSVGITSDVYTHVLGDLQAEAADRLDALFDEAEKRRAVAGEQGAWSKRGPIEASVARKARKITRFRHSPAGRGPAASRY